MPKARVRHTPEQASKPVDASQPLPVHTEQQPTWLTNYLDYSNCHIVSCTKASIHQGHSQFGLHAGKQCTCNGLAFLLYTSFTTTFTTPVLDSVLRDGFTLYSIGRYSDYLLVDELPRTSTLQNRQYTITYMPSLAGNLFAASADKSGPFRTLSQALKESLKTTSSCLLTLGHSPGATSAVYRSCTSYYYIFDPHARSEAGLPDSTGTAVMLKLRSQKAVVTYFQRYGEVLTGNPNECPFEMTPVRYTSTPLGHGMPRMRNKNHSASSCSEVPKLTSRKKVLKKQRGMNQTLKQDVPHTKSKHSIHSVLPKLASRKKVPKKQRGFNQSSRRNVPHKRSSPSIQSVVHKQQSREQLPPRRKKSPTITKQVKHALQQRRRQNERLRKHDNKIRQERRHSSQRPQRPQRSLTAAAIIATFHKMCLKNMPLQECASCQRFMFPHQVTSFDKAQYVTKYPEAAALIHNTCNSSLWICQICKRYLIHNRIPPQATINNLTLDTRPDYIESLNSLEKHLISPVIPFMKIFPKPKSMMKGILGPCVCVPSNITQVAKTLPRALEDTSLVKVKLKRKMQYKGHHLFQAVNPKNMLAALSYLKTFHPAYKDIQLDLAHPDFRPQDESIAQDASCNDTARTSEDASTILSDAPPTCQNSPQPMTEATRNENNSNYIPDTAADSCRTLEGAGSEVADLEVADLEVANAAEDSHSEHESSAPMVSFLRNEDITVEIAPAQGHIPVSLFATETTAFPYLFPTGKFGINEDRSTKLGKHQYFNSRLFSTDNRFASDPDYIFYALDFLEKQNIHNSTSLAFRKAAPSASTTVTAGMLSDEHQVSSILKKDLGYRFLDHIRGSPGYWQRTLHDLFAQVKQLGVPTWFASFSAADRRWIEIPAAILKQQGKDIPDTLTWSDHCKIINTNPVTACRMFQERVRLFFKEILFSPVHPIGEIVDFFYRIEFQSRGWPHVHALFWVKGAPKFIPGGDNTNFIEMIDNYITTDMPDLTTDHDFNKLVTSLQTHSRSHSRSCRKGNKKCRFHFPRPPSDRTFIAEPTPHDEQAADSAKHAFQKLWDILESEQHPPDFLTILEQLEISPHQYYEYHSILTQRNTVIYRRKSDASWINPYNATLLRAWDANIDLQPVLDPYSCIMYIVSYISKAERELGDLLKQVERELREGNVEPAKQLRQLGNVFIQSRDVGVMEAVYRITSMPLKACSRTVIFLPSDPLSARLTKSRAALANMDKDDPDVWAISLLDRYLARPSNPTFNMMCFAEFASKYRVVYGHKSSAEESGSDSDEERSTSLICLQSDRGYITKRKTPAVIRYPHFKRSKDSERYHVNLLRVYWPHTISDFKPSTYPTYESYFNTPTVKQTTLANLTKFEPLEQELDDAWEHMQENPHPEDAWAVTAPAAEEDRIDTGIDHSAILDLYNHSDCPLEESVELSNPASNHLLPSSSPTISSSPSIAHELSAMNHQQQELFHFVQLHALATIQGENPAPFHILLTGGAGTGKSHLIKCLYHQLTKMYNPLTDSADQITVLKIAPTGTAAFNIGGQTIHSALKISQLSKQLSESENNSLRSKFCNLQLVIIDEISMVPQNILNMIHSRLQQIKNSTSSSSWFGSTSILAVGDFHQLPPVRGQILYKNYTISNIFTQLFTRWDLHHIMRQKNDLSFAHFLNRLRVRTKHETFTPDDIQLLQSATVPSSTPEIASYLHVFSRNADVHAHNLRFLNELPTDPVCLAAEDYQTAKGHPHKRLTPITATSGQKLLLPSQLQLKPSARVMLTVNIDVPDGLVNGVLGTVTGIPAAQPGTLPPYIAVTFDHPKVGANARSATQSPAYPDAVLLKPHAERFLHKGSSVTRLQFPLTLAWAVTIHKVQGQTVENIVVSMDHIFSHGMAYVALSRVTSYKGLNIINCDPKTIYTHHDIEPAIASLPSANSLPAWTSLLPPPSMTTSTLRITSLNIESFSSHIDTVLNHYFLCHMHIFLFQETWLHSPPSTNLGDFQPLFKHRSQSYHSSTPATTRLAHAQHGGLAVLVHTSIPVTTIDTSFINAEIQAVSIEPPSLFTIVLINVYRPPSLPLQEFIQALTTLLQSLPTHQPAILMGDFNVNLKHPQPDCPLTSLTENAAFVQAISTSTTKQGTIIDHIYYRHVPALSSAVCPVTFGYHHAVVCTID